MTSVIGTAAIIIIVTLSINKYKFYIYQFPEKRWICRDEFPVESKLPIIFIIIFHVHVKQKEND